MVTARLRLLQTTDIHMHLLGYDYVTDSPSDHKGLTHLLPLIAAARDAVPLTLLFDNGDFLQGTPLADDLAATPRNDPHPMVQAFNDLRYDAVALGNHEFDYGLAVLMDALADLDMPVVCANVRTTPTRSLVAPWTVLSRDVIGSDGTSHQIKIGVIGFVTPQVVDWDAHVLNGAIRTDDILAAARSHLPAMRRAGADVIVALCHAGISDAAHTPGMENAALHLAALPDVDVVMAGHTHDHFPSADFAATAGADLAAGTLAGKPAVMAGAMGEILGQIDLTLELTPDGWQIAGHTVALRRPDAAPPTADQNRLARQLAPAQARTLGRLREPICDTPRPLTSYFAALGRDDSAPLLAAAQMSHMATALAGTDYAELPLLASTSSYRAGGHGGPANFIDIRPGPVTLRHATTIVPFDNPVAAVLRRGWQVRGWLEKASAFYNRLDPGKTDQPLVNPAKPAYHFDRLHGLRYRIDLSVAPRIGDDTGRPARVRDITYDGQPMRDDDLFVVATTSYRAHGGGGLSLIAPQDIVYMSHTGLGQILTDCLRDHGVPATAPHKAVTFVPMPGTQAHFITGPGALAHLDRIADVLAPDADPAASGFITCTIDL